MANKIVLAAVGAALAIAASLYAGATQARGFRVLYQLQSEAGSPAGLISDAAGNFYGVSTYGTNDFGSVFKLAGDGSFSVLHHFNGPDGDTPAAPLIMDPSGNLYGTTVAGGGKAQDDVCYPSGCGTVFKIAPDGTESVLYAFSGYQDGALPGAGLVADASGNLYGTTGYGGGSEAGIVFKISSKGKETILYSFGSQLRDGATPEAALVADGKGNFYGTTTMGGQNDEGVVFELTRTGKEKILYSFSGPDGNQPWAPLLRDKSGNLYGTTLGGGTVCDCGTVFKLAPDGTETVLYSFSGGSDGAYPFAGLTTDRLGTFYGTAAGGGTGQCPNQGCGTVFKLTPDGHESVLYAFQNNGDGSQPMGALLRVGKHLYGTTFGENGDGATLFALDR